MCRVSGQGWAAFPLSCLESDFLGVKSANKPGNVSMEERGSRRCGGSRHSRGLWGGNVANPSLGPGFPLRCICCWLLVIRVFMDAGWWRRASPGFAVRLKSSCSNRNGLDSWTSMSHGPVWVSQGQVCFKGKCGYLRDK